MSSTVQYRAVPCSTSNDTLSPSASYDTLELVCLIDGHLGILITMKKQERWIQAIDVEYRAGHFREFPCAIRKHAEKKFERRSPRT